MDALAISVIRIEVIRSIRYLLTPVGNRHHLPAHQLAPDVTDLLSRDGHFHYRYISSLQR